MRKKDSNKAVDLRTSSSINLFNCLRALEDLKHKFPTLKVKVVKSRRKGKSSLTSM